MSLILLLAGGLVVSFVTSAALTPWIRAVAARKEWTDAPDKERKIHTEDIPRTGGIAIVGAFLAGIAYFVVVDANAAADLGLPLPAWYLVSGAVFIGAIGFLDDLFGLHFSHKFTAQVLLGIFIMAAGYRFEVLPVSMAASPLDPGWWLSAVVTVTWIVGMINAINLLDGMDGLAAGVAVIGVASLAAVQMIQGNPGGVVLALVVAAALLGFLVYNFNPASIFMGDTGSFFVGFLLAVIALPGPDSGSSWTALLLAALVLGVPIADTTVTVLRRYLTCRPLFFPDQDHIHHRMISRRGLSHRGAVLALYLAAAVLGAAACMLAGAGSAVVMIAIAVVVLGAIYAFLRWLDYLRGREVLRLLRARRNPVVPSHPQVGTARPHINGMPHTNGTGAPTGREHLHRPV